jgi:hypothetical protein
MKTVYTVVAVVLFLSLFPPCATAQNIFYAGRNITIEKDKTVDNAVALGGQITVNGRVRKNVVAVGGSVVLTGSCVVEGKVISVGGVIVTGSGARVYGEVTEINSASLANALRSTMRGELEGWSLILNIISLGFFAIILIITLIMAILLPRPLTSIARAIGTGKLKSFFWGVLATLAIAPLFMLLAISVIGIFFIPLVFAALILGAIIGFIAVGSLMGGFLLEKIFPGRKKSLLKDALLGVTLLWVLGWLPFYIGTAIKVVALTCGFGGVLMAVARRKTAA